MKWREKTEADWYKIIAKRALTDRHTDSTALLITLINQHPLPYYGHCATLPPRARNADTASTD